MDTLTSIRVFHQVVQNGSFTKAADALDISVAMASKHIAHLERTLGANSYIAIVATSTLLRRASIIIKNLCMPWRCSITQSRSPQGHPRIRKVS